MNFLVSKQKRIEICYNRILERIERYTPTLIPLLVPFLDSVFWSRILIPSFDSIHRFWFHSSCKSSKNLDNPVISYTTTTHELITRLTSRIFWFWFTQSPFFAYWVQFKLGNSFWANCVEWLNNKQGEQKPNKNKGQFAHKKESKLHEKAQGEQNKVNEQKCCLL